MKLDFIMIGTTKKKGYIEVYPKFIVGKVQDIMIKGRDFYAIWNDETKFWSKEFFEAVRIIDEYIDECVKGMDQSEVYEVLHLYDSHNGMVDKFHRYCQKQMADNWHQLDEKVIFSNTEVTKKDYASHKLDYPLLEGPTPAYNKLMSTLYSPEERHKLEWAIGAVVNGDSKKIQKFVVLYGAAGTGKSTVLDIIAMLFDGYSSTFSSEELASNNGTFALEAFKNNPLVSYEHEGNLSRIETNGRLNALVSHEKVMVNEKFKSRYEQQFNAFLFIGTNNPVKITDSKSGLIRRLIDVQPTGNLLDVDEYDEAMEMVKFELGGIASHCKQVYEADKKYYNHYKPVLMIGETNDFYNFVLEYYDKFKANDPLTKKMAWEWYKDYIEDARVPYPYSQRQFKNELKTYFDDFKAFTHIDGTRYTDVYFGFNFKLINEETSTKSAASQKVLSLNTKKSLFDILFADCLAQVAVLTKDGRSVPEKKWAECTSKLNEIETWKTHYVKVPENLVVIDFDLKNARGEKDLEMNLKAASKWPLTYAELSNSGKGVHLHYFYDGDVRLLDNHVTEDIEVKVYSGGSALRRRVILCNDVPVKHINSGLPLKKGEKKMLNDHAIQTERGLRLFIESCLEKKHHGATKPEIDFINKKLNDAYESGMNYDVSDLRNAVLSFAASSTNQSEYCVKLVADMKFKSEEPSENLETEDYNSKPIIFFDVEVFPNLFLLNWKVQGKGMTCVRMINPKPYEVENFLRSGRLVGFNNRRYDNHIVYAASIGYSNKELYNLSKQIIKDHTGFFGEAYNLSYTDIYDYCATKQSLKVWEIQLGIHHMELGFDWDSDVPEDKWLEVAEYCDNDVISTEAVWDATQGDFTARMILADLADMTVNDTSNSLTTRIIFGKDKKPKLIYTDLATGESTDGSYHENNKFEGYEYKRLEGDEDDGKYHNVYRGTDVGKGGYVYAEPGIYSNVALIDVASMHPHSIEALNYFGEYTQHYVDLINLRLHIKHKEYDKAKHMFDGKLVKYLEDEKMAKALAKAIKIPLNSCYGLTSAAFENPFKDPRNVNNIVALRGALFMRTLQDEVMRLGFKVCHIKTDSIKIPNATPAIIDFCKDFAQKYGYTFEHEATYNRICLVNDAVYIAKYETSEKCAKRYGYIPSDNKEAEEEGKKWTATGTEFQVPYIFKTLFTHKELEFNDLCETKSVQKGSIHVDMNEGYPDVSDAERVIDEIESLRNAVHRYYARANYVGEENDIWSDEKLTKKFMAFDKRYGTDMTNHDDWDIELEKFEEPWREKVATGHNYIFVGRVGQFCPIRPGCGGGELNRKTEEGKYVAVTGTKGWRWLESEIVKNLHKEDMIDMDYWKEKAEDAKKSIWEFGDYDFFVSDKDYPEPKFIARDEDFIGHPVYEEEVPFY